jgi:hypothetical protein
VGEEPLDRWQRELMKDGPSQPLNRMASRIHVTEEARHITYALEEPASTMSQRIGRTYRRRVAQNLVSTSNELSFRPALFAVPTPANVLGAE